jgi:hypothetical protein
VRILSRKATPTKRIALTLTLLLPAIYSFEKGKSQCSMTITKLTPSTVEGTAECAVVNEQGGSGKSPLTNVRFFATTAMSS